MYHVTLHKSLDDVDVTYKADVKFNVMAVHRRNLVASPPSDAFRSLQLRHGLDMYLPRDVLISII